jgi:carbamoyl-phosphate synthase large subunit
VDDAIEVANKVGYPVLVRPSYVLGGQRMRIVINDDEVEKAVVSLLKHLPGNKILIDHFLDRCQEAEVDAIFDGENFHVMGVMEHIEPAGIHSGDSNAVLPAFNLAPLVVTTMEYYSEKIARALNIKGLINIQFAIKNGKVFVIEANPRASRPTPFIAKAYQIPYLNIATKVMLGDKKLTDFTFDKKLDGFAIKEPVFSFDKFPGVNKELGPEMKSTGEVKGVGKTFGEAFIKSQLGAGVRLPRAGQVVLSVKQSDKPRMVEVARALLAMGFTLAATKGTAAAIQTAGMPCKSVNKVAEGRPHIVDMIKNDEVVLVINTVEERRNAIADSRQIRTSALQARVTTYTTMAGAEAAVDGMQYLDHLGVISVQEMHAQLLA